MLCWSCLTVLSSFELIHVCKWVVIKFLSHFDWLITLTNSTLFSFAATGGKLCQSKDMFLPCSFQGLISRTLLFDVSYREKKKRIKKKKKKRLLFTNVMHSSLCNIMFLLFHRLQHWHFTYSQPYSLITLLSFLLWPFFLRHLISG